jgi:hypothetical protein
MSGASTTRIARGLRAAGAETPAAQIGPCARRGFVCLVPSPQSVTFQVNQTQLPGWLFLQPPALLPAPSRCSSIGSDRTSSRNGNAILTPRSAAVSADAHSRVLCSAIENRDAVAERRTRLRGWPVTKALTTQSSHAIGQHTTNRAGAGSPETVPFLPYKCNMPSPWSVWRCSPLI